MLKLNTFIPNYTNHKCILEDNTIVNYDVSSAIPLVANTDNFIYLGYGKFYSVDKNGVTKLVSQSHAHFYKKNDVYANTNNNIINDNKLDIFYFPKYLKLVIIPKYYTNGSGDLSILINNLLEVKSFLSTFIDIEKTKIYCNEILYSSKYKGKWSFICNYNNNLILPDNTFIVNDWSIHDWLTY